MKRKRKFLSLIKKQVITCFGIRKTFRIKIEGIDLIVDYILSRVKPDRDYFAILSTMEDCKCFYDVGANHGIIALLAAKKNKNLDVHAFEASESAVNVINHNISLNKLNKNIRAVNTLIADKSGNTIPFYWQDSSGGASITKGRLGHTIEIYKSTLSLDDYTAYHQLSPDYIKMDIEGAENLVILGMKNILKLNRPLVFIELHGFGEKKLWENAKDILEFANQFNYLMIYLRTGEPISDAEVLSDRGRCHVLLTPEEKYSHEFKHKFKFSGL